jgi:23S rRNA pseudouridine955/2504/2580 synthase
VPYSLLAKALRKGWIKLNDQKTKLKAILNEGDRVSISEHIIYGTSKVENTKKRISDQLINDIKNRIIYQDDDLMVINKPAGLAVQGGTRVKVSLDDILEYMHLPTEEKPRLVHRLDKETSGIILVARTKSAAQYLTSLFKDGKVEKCYSAVLVGMPPKMKGTIRVPLTKYSDIPGGNKVVVDQHKGSYAETRYRVISSNDEKNLCLVECYPLTGRTHQLRVHFAHIGAPILGDNRYGGKKATLNNSVSDLYLHATRTSFLNRDNEVMKFEIPTPSHMQTMFTEKTS